MKWLAGLFGHLDERLEEDGCDNTMRLTAEYLRASGECGDCEGALEWLAERGGFCDCEVLLNVEPPDDGDAIEASTRAYERIIEAAGRRRKPKKRMLKGGQRLLSASSFFRRATRAAPTARSTSAARPAAGSGPALAPARGRPPENQGAPSEVGEQTPGRSCRHRTRPSKRIPGRGAFGRRV